MPVRRVVSGQEATGKSRIVSDEIIEETEVRPGVQFTPLWGGDQPPRFPLNGAPPAYRKRFPGPGGYRLALMTRQPGDVRETATALSEAAAADLVRRRLVDTDDVMEIQNPGMHATDTVDFEIVLSGEVSEVPRPAPMPAT